MTNSKTGLNVALETLVAVAVILVLVHALVAELAIVLGWTWQARLWLLVVGFALDLFFTVEFLVRFYYSVLDRRAGRYVSRERGWVDLLASIPVLLLFSGPAVLALAAGTTPVGLAAAGGVAAPVAAARAVRLLRLLRVVKLFTLFGEGSSPMRRRHLGAVATMGAIAVVLVAAAHVASVSTGVVPGLEGRAHREYVAVASFIDARNLGEEENDRFLRDYVAAEPSILVVTAGGRTCYSRHDNEYYRRYFGPGDYSHARSGGVEVFYDRRPLNAQAARRAIGWVLTVGLYVLILGTAYRRHFSRTVTEPLWVMIRGLGEHGYNLEVRVPDRYRSDEVFRLAGLYNTVYLPQKDRAAVSAPPEFENLSGGAER